MTSLDNVSFYLFIILLISASDVNSKNTTVEEKIKHDSDLSGFYSHLETNAMANATLLYRDLTVFAPTNKAFQNYRSNISIDSLVSYHMVTAPVSFDRLYSGQSLSTDYPGNPYLWVTRKNNNEVYVNNAKIDRYRSNYIAWNNQRKTQVLHIIDDVLEPVVSTNLNHPIYNPDAFTFLNQSEEFALGSHRLRTFRQRVHQLNKQNIFSAPGHYTFFIPIDDGFQPPPRSDKIDGKIIDGHVVPRYVLFTGPTPQGQEYPTLAMGDMMKVTVSFTHQNDGKHQRIYVKSSTLQGDSNHANGVVLAEIVRANIPVKNGVVHLIHRPLMVVDSTVTQFLKDDINGPLYKFYRVILEAGGDFMNRINRLREVTLFAPSNEAWNETHLDRVLKDQTKLREIIDLHVVESKLPMDQIISNNQKEIFMAPTSGGRRNLYFNVVQGPYNNRTLTVEGGGVNATVIQPDIAATNGVIHIINHVLGVPYQNMRDKLLTDPMLNKTATLGQKTHFNENLKNLARKYTYFVPRDYAWKKAEVQFPSAHKKLFMAEFQYHVQQVLERHLVINDHAYTMAELFNMSRDSYITLPTLRDSLKIKVKEVDRSGHGYDVTNNYNAPRKGYALEWRGETVHVFRPDVYCTNGIIHVIDRVLLQESDVRVNGEPTVASASLFLNLCLVLIAKFYF